MFCCYFSFEYTRWSPMTQAGKGGMSHESFPTGPWVLHLSSETSLALSLMRLPLLWLPGPTKRMKAVYCFLTWLWRLIKLQTDSSAVGWDHKGCYNRKRPAMIDGVFSRLCHFCPWTRLLLHPPTSGLCSMGWLLHIGEAYRQLAGGGAKTKDRRSEIGSI